MANKAVLIADPELTFAQYLQLGFEQLGYVSFIVQDVNEGVARCRERKPELVVSEQRFPSGTWQDLSNALREANISAPFAIVTASPSITGAVAATRSGTAAYLAKPATASNVLDAIASRLTWEAAPTPARSYCSLERAKWEYIHMTLASSGSIAEAARRLRIERRSLRRMLAKVAPAQ